MAYSVPRIAVRLLITILLYPVVRITLGLALAAFLFVDGALMAEKLTTLGYAFMLEGVLCLLVAIASIFQR